jgi:hypothetical protein
MFGERTNAGCSPLASYVLDHHTRAFSTKPTLRLTTAVRWRIISLPLCDCCEIRTVAAFRDGDIVPQRGDEMTHARIVTVALMTLFWLSLIGVSAASAVADTYEAPGSITLMSTNTQKFKTPNGTVECKKFIAKGNVKHAGEEWEATGLDYKECKAFGVAATVRSNGCAYVFSAPVDNGADPKHKANVSIACPTGKTMVVETSICEVKVFAQGAKEESEYENDLGPVKLSAHVQHIEGRSTVKCAPAVNKHSPPANTPVKPKQRI